MELQAVDARLPAADVAYMLLKSKGKPMTYRELIGQVLAAKHADLADFRAQAQVNTEINLDTRFVHMGGGLWALREWAPRTSRQRGVPLSPLLRSRRDDERADYAAEDEEDEVEAGPPADEVEWEDDDPESEGER